MSGNKDIYIVYGSQTGNSEDIAKDLEDKCRSADIPVVRMTLNAVKKEKISLKDVAKFLVVVCSTTGNGDAPENADAWWRGAKLRSAVSPRHCMNIAPTLLFKMYLFLYICFFLYLRMSHSYDNSRRIRLHLSHTLFLV
jgi:Flavodoxin